MKDLDKEHTLVGGVQSKKNINLTIKKILKNEPVLESELDEAISQIKTIILEALKAEMPKPEEEGFGGKDPSIAPNERDYEATARNELLADCLDVCNKLLGDSNAE